MAVSVIDDAVLSQAPRLAAVHRAELALPERRVSADAAAHLVARAGNAPIGLVSLVRSTNTLCAGLFGAPPELMSSRRLPLTGSLCPLVVSADQPLVIDDTSAHAEYATFEAVVRYGVRAYLGVPLRDRRGRVLGAVAAVDTSPRHWTNDDLDVLLQLAQMLGPLPEGDPLTDHRVGAAAVLDALGEPLISLDDDGRISEYNTAAARMFGWSPAESLGRSVEELMLPSGQWAGVRSAAGRVTGDPAGSPWRQTMTFRRRAGGKVPVEVLVSALDTPSGRRWAMVVLDGAERADADRLSAQRAGFLQAVLDSLDTGVAACDADGRVVVINRALREAHGVPAEGPVDVTLLEGGLFRPDGAPLPLRDAPLMHALRGTPVRGAELVIKATDAPARIFAANAEPIRDADGLLTGAVVATHDITMQRRAERFRACELDVATALSSVDTIAQAGPRITEVVANTLRWPHAELWLLDAVTDTLRDVGHWTSPDVRLDRGGDGPVVKGLGITGTVWATGQPLWVPDISRAHDLAAAVPSTLAHACARAGLRTAVAVPINDGTMIGVLCCFADNHEYDEAEIVSGLRAVASHIGRFLSRQHTEALTTQLDRTRDDFIALVGHELRTPLTAIGSHIQLLLTDEQLDADTKQMLSPVDRNTASLTAIVDDLLDLSALHSGHATMHLRPCDLSAVVRESLEAIAPAAQANHVTLDVDLPDSLIIDADPSRLRQVVDNLLSNAVKYSPGGGTATVTLSTDADTAVFSVCDTGIGVPAEERTHLFRTFFRATNARHSTIAGTGLGLVITRAIVEAHHGIVTATHNDPGTTITVRLPTTGATTD